MQITFGSLFAGIGGFDLGFERAGMTCKWQVEIDDYASRVLAKHWPNVHRERDIRECGAHNLQPVDVICGGFPCQDISYAGLGAGLDGERSGLFFEAIRVVRELQPRVVVLENVAALLTRGLDRVLGALAEIGYDAEWHCIPAAIFGAHFRRDRIFVIASRSIPGRVRSQRIRPDKNRAWSEQQFARLVEHELRVCVPAGKNKRVSDGVPARMDRLRGLGNAVVPQVAEWIGQRVVQQSQT
jgi:DNA (cytosine-5)-methyltransferase 1